jgi:tRNA1Val (adenine37-N6)-methyltransferase
VANHYFQFKQFIIHQDRCAMKVTTDSCLFGAWVAEEVKSQLPIAIGTEVKKILDVGTGTALLSMMIAQKNNLPIDAIEIDHDAFVQASENINASLWKDRVKIFHADIKDFNRPTRYDIIVSNPPFYENEWQSGNLKRNTAHHSSELLLEDLLDIVAAMLKPGGRFYLLLPYKRHEEILKLLDQKKIFLAQKILVRQTDDHDYFRFMIEGGFEKPAPAITKELAIKNKNNEYAVDFTALLKDYYLYL